MSDLDYTVPTPSVTVGPDYAEDASDALTVIKSHNHDGTGTGGQQITPDALNITGDVPFQNHNISAVRTVRFTEQASSPNGTGDVACLYVKTDHELYCRDGSGVEVQITTDGALRSVFTGFERHALAGNLTILPGDTFTFIDVDTTSARTITLPSAAAVDAGRAFIIIDATGSAQTNPITINRDGSDTMDGATSYVIRQAYGGLLIMRGASTVWRAESLFNTHAGNIALGTAPARSGALSLSNDSYIYTRNGANSSDVKVIGVDSSDVIQIGDPGVNVTFSIAAAACNLGGPTFLILNASTTGATFGDTGTPTTLQGQGIALMNSTNGYTVDIGNNDDAQNPAMIRVHRTGTPATNGVSIYAGGGEIFRTNEDGSGFLHSSVVSWDTGGAKLAFYGGTARVQPTITGALSAVTDANAKAVLTSLVAALASAAGVNLVIDGTT